MDLHQLVLLLVVVAAPSVVLGWLLGSAHAAGTTAALRTELDAERRVGRERLEQARVELDAEQRAGAERLEQVRGQLEDERRAARERLEELRADQQRLVHEFDSLAARALNANNERFLAVAEQRLRQAQDAQVAELSRRATAVEHLVAPIKDVLANVEGQLRGLEQARLESYARLTEQVGQVQRTSEGLQMQTRALVTALSAPQARGRWGEMQLRRVVEMAGMVEHCDFVEQPSVRADSGFVRPDLVVRMAGGRHVVVDAKVSLVAYLEAAETADPSVRQARLTAHAKSLRRHVDDLAGKAYWSQFSPTPEFVVLFVPGEAFLAPALEAEPALLEHAMTRRVIIATPTTLMSLLRTVAYAWQQDALTDNARAVFDLGRDLYDRLSTLGAHVDKLGRSVSRVVADYNTAVGSLEGRVLVTARKLKELAVVEAELATPQCLNAAPRPLGARELSVEAEQAQGRAVLLLPEPPPAPDGGPFEDGTPSHAGQSRAPDSFDEADPVADHGAEILSVSRVHRSMAERGAVG